MAGHSHWAGIKHRKGAQDAKRGKIFSKHAKAIMTAARLGGGDPEMNLKLKYAIDKAKADNMPKDNIERAVKKGTGELEGSSLEEVAYEGYGQGGVAIIVETLTDNRNRTGPEIKRTFEKKGGNLGEPGCVSWMFDRKSSFLVKGENLDEEALMEVVLELEAEDYQSEGDKFLIIGSPTDFGRIGKLLQEREGLELEQSEITLIPKNTITLEDVEVAKKIIVLMEALDDLEDVQSCYANFEIPEEMMGNL
ncbi:MAG: YebC/PmpR family DNA-binding transcriptional regulator [Planctomycetota bacterium]|jgi:YebC/PmpR family DNA-binding regulatory protein